MYGIKKQIKSAGSESILFAHKASVLLDEKSSEEALTLCEEGVKFFPFYAEGHFVLAKCYHSKGRLDDAQKEYEKVLHYLPGHLKALKALAYIYFKHQQDQEAQKVLQNFVLYDPLNTELIEFLKSKGYYKILSQPAAETVSPESDAVELQEKETYSAEDILPSEFDTEADDDELQPEVQEYEEVPVLNLDGDDANVPYDADAFNPDLTDDVEIPPAAFDSENGDIPQETSQDQFEINNIVDTIDEEPQDDTSINLNDFDNTEDDFSTIMDDVFDKPSEEEDNEGLTESEISEAAENHDNESDAEVEAEERPLLDTTIIFNEQRQDEKDDDVKSGVNIDQIVSGIENDSAEKADEIEAGMEEMIPDEINEVLPDLEETTDEISETTDSDADLSGIDTAIETAEADNIDKAEAEPAGLPAEIDEVAAAEKQTEDEAEEIIAEPSHPKEILEDTADEISPLPVSEPADEKIVMPDEEHVDIDDILSNPSLLTPTFGEILIAQRKFDDARQVFLELLKRQPDDERFKKKINFLDKIVAMDKKN